MWLKSHQVFTVYKIPAQSEKWQLNLKYINYHSLNGNQKLRIRYAQLEESFMFTD